jgi:drug/metabolite transporter (DMT)-like permease
LPPSVRQVHRGWRDYAMLLALACCWSSTYPLTKIGLGSIPPITFISARSLVAAVFLLVILRTRRAKPPRDRRRHDHPRRSVWKVVRQVTRAAEGLSLLAYNDAAIYGMRCTSMRLQT